MITHFSRSISIYRALSILKKTKGIRETSRKINAYVLYVIFARAPLNIFVLDIVRLISSRAMRVPFTIRNFLGDTAL